jgi:hypothetical protein
MPQPALAFAPGSPASGASSLIQGALASIFGAGGVGSFGFSSSSSSSSGDAFQGGSEIGGSMDINYGNGVTQGAGAVPWVKAALVAGLVALAVKRFA